jgi:hypothetical protein
MAEYKLTLTGAVIRESDGASIPPDDANRDYQEFLAWQADGGVPDPADPAPEPETPPAAILRQIWQDTEFDETAHAVIDAILALMGG